MGIAEYHLLEGSGRPIEVARRVGEALQSAQVDIAFVGIFDNGHLAFNDSPADFQTEESYLIVTPDEVCLHQQVGEGWFRDISEVPLRAISMSVKQILKAKEIIWLVPLSRKVRRSSYASMEKSARWRRLLILRTDPSATIFLDTESASLLSPAAVSAFAATS